MKIGILFLCCLLAGGCVSARHNGSFDALSAAHAVDAQSLAAQTADELSARHAPAHTPLNLHRAPGLFGEALETELRSRGFALTDAGSPLGVRYTVDVIPNDPQPLGYVQVSCTDNRFFSFTRPLGTMNRPRKIETPPAPATHAPESLPVRESAPATRQAVEPAAKTWPVSATAPARVIARRNGLPVGAFCRWNGVDADAILEKGRPVYLAEPSASSRPAAVAPATGGVAEKGPHAPAVSSVPASPSVSASPLDTPAAAPSAVATPVAFNPLKKSAEPASTTPPVAPVQTALADLTAVSGAAEPAHAVAVPLWEVSQGRMLREQLTDWAVRAGYSLVWSAQNDYELRGSATFRGEFIDAVKRFFAALQSNGLALRVTIYQGNQVMEVSEH